MKLGFVSAILADWSLEQVLQFASKEGFQFIEPMCWPLGKSERRYAGVTHLDVANLGVAATQALCAKYQVSLSGLGYYPNPLDPNPQVRETVTAHLKQVITAAKLLSLPVVNTFIGRDWTKSIDEQWPLFHSTWRPIVDHAQKEGVKIAIENCPMLFSKDEWPGGKNLATTPAVWRRIFSEFPSLGLNIDPSHLIWQFIDVARCIREFGPKIYHVHAKDTRIDHDKLYEQGSMGLGWHTPKLPGLGDVNWSGFFSALTDTGYDGPICIEVEDRAFEKSEAGRLQSLRISKKYLEQFVG